MQHFVTLTELHLSLIRPLALFYNQGAFNSSRLAAAQPATANRGPAHFTPLSQSRQFMKRGASEQIMTISSAWGCGEVAVRRHGARSSNSVVLVLQCSIYVLCKGEFSLL